MAGVEMSDIFIVECVLSAREGGWYRIMQLTCLYRNVYTLHARRQYIDVWHVYKNVCTGLAFGGW